MLSLFKVTVYHFSPETSKGKGREVALLLQYLSGAGGGGGGNLLLLC